MDIQNIYDDVRPYLSDPKAVLDFIEERKENSIEQIIQDINGMLPDSEGSFKTDLRILLNALLKQK